MGVAEYELRASNTKVKDFIPPPIRFFFVLWSQMAIQAPSFVLTVGGHTG